MSEIKHMKSSAGWKLGDGLWWRDGEGLHGMMMTKETEYGKRGGYKQPGEIAEITTVDIAETDRVLAEMGFSPLGLADKDIKWLGDGPDPLKYAPRGMIPRRTPGGEERTMEDVKFCVVSKHEKFNSRGHVVEVMFERQVGMWIEPPEDSEEGDDRWFEAGMSWEREPSMGTMTLTLTPEQADEFEFHGDYSFGMPTRVELNVD